MENILINGEKIKMKVLIEGEKKKINKVLIFFIIYLLEFFIQFIMAYLIPVIVEDKEITSTDYFIKILIISFIMGTIIGVIVSKVMEKQDEKRFIIVTEFGVKGIANESFSTKLREFSIKFKDIDSIDLRKNAIIINTYDDSYICSGYGNVSKIKDIIIEKF